VLNTLQHYAECISRGEMVHIGLEFEGSIPQNADEVENLEIFHTIHDMYLWLGSQFEGLFVDMELVREQRVLVSNAIQIGIENIGVQNLKYRLENRLKR